MRIGILTGGGDCPGLNAVIRAVVRKGERTYGDELIGFQDGWKGVLLDGRVVPLGVEQAAIITYSGPGLVVKPFRYGVAVNVRIAQVTPFIRYNRKL